MSENKNVKTKQTSKKSVTQTESKKENLSNSQSKTENIPADENKGKMSEDDLKEVYKLAYTGMESVEILKKFSTDKGFRNLLIKQYKEYSSLAKEIELYANQKDLYPEKTSFCFKGGMYFSVAMSTMFDKSDSKLSEIMMQGIDRGIIALTRLLNKLAEENRSCIFAEKLLAILQKNYENTKLFL